MSFIHQLLLSFLLSSYIFYHGLFAQQTNREVILTPETICTQINTTSTVCAFYRLPNSDDDRRYGTFHCNITSPTSPRIKLSREGVWLTGVNIFSGNLFIGGKRDKYQLDDFNRYYFHATPSVANRFFKLPEKRYGEVTIDIIDIDETDKITSLLCTSGNGLASDGNTRDVFPQWYG